MRKLPLEYSTLKQVPTGSGVYIVFTDKSFARLKGKTNIIYIGKANNLKKRLRTFWVGVRKARYRFERLKRAGFYLSYEFVVTPDSLGLEKKLLNKFEARHLELPPLNHAL